METVDRAESCVSVTELQASQEVTTRDFGFRALTYGTEGLPAFTYDERPFTRGKRTTGRL